MNVAVMNVTLSQKRRGRGGKYEEISAGDGVRVDKHKGKILKLRVFSNDLDLSCVDFSAHLVLHADYAEPVITHEGLSVESVNVDSERPCHIAEILLKILRNAKQLQVCVSATVSNVCVGFGTSVCFQSHNNGKQKPTHKKRGDDSVLAVRSLSPSPLSQPAVISSPVVTEVYESPSTSPFSFDDYSSPVMDDVEVFELKDVSLFDSVFLGQESAVAIGQKRTFSDADLVASDEDVLPHFDFEEFQQSCRKRARTTADPFLSVLASPFEFDFGVHV